MEGQQASVAGPMARGTMAAGHQLKDEEPIRNASAAMAAAQAASQLLNDVCNRPEPDRYTTEQLFEKDTVQSVAAPQSHDMTAKPTNVAAVVVKEEQEHSSSDANAASGLLSLKDHTSDERKSGIDSFSTSPLIHRHLIEDNGATLRLPKMMVDVLQEIGHRNPIKAEHSLPSVRDIIGDLRRDDETHPRRRRARGFSYNAGMDADLPRTLPRSQTESISSTSNYPRPLQFSPTSARGELSPVLHFRKPALGTAHSAPEPVMYGGPVQPYTGEKERTYVPKLSSTSSSGSTAFLSHGSRSGSLASSSQPSTVDAMTAMDIASSPADTFMGSYQCTHPGCGAAPFQTQYLLK